MLVSVTQQTGLMFLYISKPSHDKSSYYMKVKVAQLYPTLCQPIDCSPPGSVHGILQARILKWLPCPFPEIFLIQVSNPNLPHCKQTLYHLSYSGVCLLYATVQRYDLIFYYIPHTVPFIPMTQLFCNWKFMPLNLPHLFLYSPRTRLSQVKHNQQICSHTGCHSYDWLGNDTTKLMRMAWWETLLCIKKVIYRPYLFPIPAACSSMNTIWERGMAMQHSWEGIKRKQDP